MGERYSAFISYSHRDAVVARWLHGQLERYRFPRRLIGRMTRRGPVPARLGRIFRDREEFPADTSLSHAVERAIAASDALIIVGSPDAANSPWVAREIETFRQVRPDGPILIALARGEPADAFPPAALTDGNEPLAADLRKQGDGRRLGLLKLLAGLIELPLGDLVQRDAQRRLRRVTAVTVAALIGLLALTASSVVAIRARHEAEQRRTAAEGLIEFMQTDLRQRLKEVNRLDVLTTANRHALAYYAGQDLDALRLNELARRARILQAMGEDDLLERKQPEDAQRAFGEAYRTTTALLARDPNDPDIVFTHAQSEYWIGALAWERRDLVAAGRAFENYDALAERLVTLAPRDPRSLREIGYATGNLCTLREAQQQVTGLLDLCRESLRAMQQVAAMHPDDPEAWRDVANRQAWVADVYRKQLHDLPAARRHRDAEAAIVARMLRRAPTDAQWQRKRIWSERAIAALEGEMGAVEGGTARLRAAIRDLERLVNADPANHGLAETLAAMKQDLQRLPMTKGGKR
jgi:hypothetical protein